MTASALLTELKQTGFAVTVSGDAIRITPASKLSDSQRDRLREHKAGILAALKKPPRLGFAAAKQQITAALDLMTTDERQAVIDAINEQTAIIALETSSDYQTAMKAAERNVFKSLLHL